MDREDYNVVSLPRSLLASVQSLIRPSLKPEPVALALRPWQPQNCLASHHRELVRYQRRHQQHDHSSVNAVSAETQTFDIHAIRGSVDKVLTVCEL